VVALIIVGLILGVIIAALSFIHPAIGMAVALAIYIPVVLCLYPLMFAGHYFVWKSILGDGASPPEVSDSTVAA
jgi:uncharacterized protein YneF (UPF0154 family)